jgi:dynein heavy chain
MAWRRAARHRAGVALASSLRPFGPRRATATRRAGGNVEKWLVEVETIMKKSLALSIDLACDEFFKIERRQWLRNWPGQTILTVNQITWVMAMEDAIENGGGPAIAAVLAQRVEELLDVVDTVLTQRQKST